MQPAPSPIRRIVEQAFNQGNLSVVDELLAPDHHAHLTFGGVPNGPQGLKLMIAMYRTAFPDLLCTVEDEIVKGDKFSMRWTMHGTNRGMFLGNPPTGKQIDVSGIMVGRIKNGRMIEDWTLIDQMSILQQLGLIPPMIRV